MALKMDGRDDVDKLDDRGDEDKLDDRGDEDKLDDRGGAEMVQDILRRASNLGGLLVVAFVTPIPGNGATHAAPVRPLRKRLDQADQAVKASAAAAKSMGGARKTAASPGHG